MGRRGLGVLLVLRLATRYTVKRLCNESFHNEMICTTNEVFWMFQTLWYKALHRSAGCELLSVINTADLWLRVIEPRGLNTKVVPFIYQSNARASSCVFKILTGWTAIHGGNLGRILQGACHDMRGGFPNDGYVSAQAATVSIGLQVKAKELWKGSVKVVYGVRTARIKLSWALRPKLFYQLNLISKRIDRYGWYVLY